MLDIVLEGGWVVDGAGNPPSRQDVAVMGDRIAAVGDLTEAQAADRIDASGMVVCPGFIDAHSHSDWTVLGNPTAESAIRQGVTSEVVGNCGTGLAPVSDLSRHRVRAMLEGYAYHDDVAWDSHGDLLRTVSDQGTSINYAWLVGLNALRSATGVDGPAPTTTQSKTMASLLEASLEAGAIGLSTGLEFEPGRQALEPEIEQLARVVRRYRGMYVSHIRNRDSLLAPAVDECLRLIDAAGGRGQVSHLNVRENTGAAAGAWDAAVASIERARRNGLDVLTDTISMRTGIGFMAAILPPWVSADGTAEAVRRLGDPAVRNRLRSDCDRYWRFIHRGEWSRVRLLASPQFPEYNGWTFPEIAAHRGTDEWDAYFDLLVAAGSAYDQLIMFGTLYSEEHLRAMVANPLFMLASDAMNSTIDGPLAERTRQPLVYNGQTYYLTHHVREVGTLRLEEAVRKMTSMPARHFGLTGRGLVAPDHFADLCAFRPEDLRSPSTIAAPHAYAEGMRYVIVNGVVTLDDGRHTGARSGRQLLRS